ncbi:Transcription factor vrtR1 [Hyphodiscus hymeniophilus]|uniref:Transcription factor vrtR1 n=1 Tax=Hyphodiscus hymeniophilus TaxID=353542 RepID=A0A9P7AWQ5_9HELO|nr:Transcription factor vrtR1 [Hyphodiscus hymeniophilus]
MQEQSQASALEAERVEQLGSSSSDVKKYSCISCRQRKIRCDRRIPCSNCTKASRPCNFVDPVRGKRKKRTATKEGLHAKLRRYEELLRSYGADIEPSESGTNNFSDAESVSEHDVHMAEGDAESAKMSASSPFTFDETKTKLISKNGSSRYFDTYVSFAWSMAQLGRRGMSGLRRDTFPISDNDQFHHPVEEGISGSLDTSTVQESDYLDNSPQESELVLGNTPKNADLATLHFPLHILEALLEIYRVRVDPLMKFLHLPTLWPVMRHSLEDGQELSKSFTAIVFSIYFTTITSLEENECFSLLGEQKSTLAIRYKTAARQALINADFLKSSSLMTLQAYATFLMGMRGHMETTSMYILSGIAVRLARRMGLHRDGTMLGLPMFETEMRRRLWWHIVQVDWQTSDHSGTKASMDLFVSDAKNPLNIEDEDIGPDMVNPPPERTGITSLVLLLLRCDIMEFLRQIAPQLSTDIGSPLPGWSNLTSTSVPISDKENMINQMEDMLERKYLRYYDPSNSLHYFSSILARSSICKMKLLAHNPRQYANSGAKVPQRSRDILFANATKMLEYASLSLSNENLKKFTWQVSTGYLWDTLHCVLVEVRERKTGPQVDRAWQLIGAVFMNYPQIFAETTDALYAALGNWTLTVWDEVSAARSTERLPESPTPEFIVALRRCRRPTAEKSLKSDAATDSGQPGNTQGYGEVPSLGYDGNQSANLEMTDMYDFPNLLSFEMEPDEWMQWERLLSGQTL